jgi:ribosome-binding ATPase YchF (GTP1/OBG family)
MERVKSLLLFLEKSNSEQTETLKEVLYLFESLILEINEDLADQTAAAMKEQKSYEIDKLQSEYKNNLKLLKQIKYVLNTKDGENEREDRYKELIKKTNKPEIPPFLPNSITLKRNPSGLRVKTNTSFINEENFKGKIPDNLKMVNDLIMEQFSD